MSKYEEISEKATAYAAAFMAQRFACERVAHIVRSKVISYFGAPEEAIAFVELDEELKAIHTTRDSLRVIQGRDGMWYFGLLMSFEVKGRAAWSKLYLTFGCRSSGERATLKLERSYEVGLRDHSGWEPLLSELEADLISHYSRSPTEPARPIGFMAARSGDA
jgi:hypothetical protein